MNGIRLEMGRKCWEGLGAWCKVCSGFIEVVDGRGRGLLLVGMKQGFFVSRSK